MTIHVLVPLVVGNWKYHILSFARDIRPLFTPVDIEHMLGVNPNLNLGSYASVKANASDIHNVLSLGAMPPDRPWPKSKVDTFKQWMDEGFPE